MYRITKTYGAELGLSACFRQPQAQSHCRYLHGYALSFKVTLEADTLDANHWVLDFGGFKPFKAWLINSFDHRMLVAQDDPMREELLELGRLGLADPLLVPAIGCESFAKMAWDKVLELVLGGVFPHDVRLVEVEVREHAGNSAIYLGEKR